MKLFSLQKFAFLSRPFLVFLAIIFLLTFSLFPSETQAASIFNQVGGAIIGIGGKAANLLLDTVVAPMAGGMSFLSLKLFKGFLQLSTKFTGGIIAALNTGDSYTSPSNPVIGAGWTFLRDLVNVFFIIGLAYIGLMTALNLASFDTQKTFGKLILVALLINFSPVICGLVVDISHIFMSFFPLSEAGFQSFVNVFNELSSNIEFFNFEPTSLAADFIMILYGLLAGLIIFAFGFYFLVRKIAIWFAVILSPLAFFCWIFDTTKKYYDQWLKQFLFWTFTGVTVSFIIYLTSIVVTTNVKLFIR